MNLVKGCILGGMALLFAGGAQARKVVTDTELDARTGTRIEIISVFDPPPPTGYAPMRVVATNGTEKDAQWSLSFDCSTHQFRSQNSHRSDFALEIPARSTESRLFLVPVAVGYGYSAYRNNQHQMHIHLSAGGLGSRDFQDYEQRADGFPAIAISKVLADNAITRLEDELEKRMTSASRGSGDQVFGSRFDLADLPEDWRGFSGFDVLMLTHTEWLGMKPGVRLAVAQWVRLGGRLHLFMGAGATAASLDLPQEVVAGKKNMSLGEVRLFSYNGSLSATEVVNRYWQGKEHEKELTEEYAGMSAGKAVWPLLRALGERNFASWQVLLFLIVFGILVGPVNLFVLAPASRRHRLFVTTPLLSLGASAVMIAVLLVQDGIGGSGGRFVAVNLEPGETTAYVTQEQACRTGLLTSAGFELKQAVVVEPLALPDTPWVKLKSSGGSQAVQLQLNGSQFSGNFFQSRAEQGHLLRAAVPTRARLELKRGLPPEAPPELVSALGFTVKELFYVDAQGVAWRSPGPLATGQAGKLEKSDIGTLHTWWKHVCKTGGTRTQDRLEQQLNMPREVFFATATQAPDFVFDTLKSIRWSDDQVVVFGSVPKL